MVSVIGSVMGSVMGSIPLLEFNQSLNYEL